MKVIFLDIETTGLDVDKDDITEIAFIHEGIQVSRIIEHSAEPTEWVREKTDYLTRIAPAEKLPIAHFLAFLKGLVSREGIIHIVGANPAFDVSFLKRAWKMHRVDEWPFHFRLIDVEAMAFAVLDLDEMPSLRDIRHLLNIPGEMQNAHTALGDAMEVQLVYETIRERVNGMHAHALIWPDHSLDVPFVDPERIMKMATEPAIIRELMVREATKRAAEIIETSDPQRVVDISADMAVIRQQLMQVAIKHMAEDEINRPEYKIPWAMKEGYE